MEASRPLIAAMRDGGLSADAAVQACRLLMWATVGFVAMEQGSSAHGARCAARPPVGEQPGRRHRGGGRRAVRPPDRVLIRRGSHACTTDAPSVRQPTATEPHRHPGGMDDDEGSMGSAVRGGAGRWSVTAAPAGAQSSGKEKPTATDVGITPTEIHIAMIADVDNSFAPGLFKASVDGVRGVVKYINATGGLAGRKLVMDFYDSHVNPNDTAAAEISGVPERRGDGRHLGGAAQHASRRCATARTRPARPPGLPDIPYYVGSDRPLVLDRVVPDRAAGVGLLHQGRPPADLPGQRRPRALVPAEVRRRPARHLRVRQRLAGGA